MGETFGYKLAHPKPGEAVVISGLSGRYPDADNTRIFAESLYNKIDLVSDDTRRWRKTHDEIPQRTGKINFINKLDAGYFGFPQRHAYYADPMLRVTLERAIEAIIDAGFNPTELEGTKTDIIVGVCSSETEKKMYYEHPVLNSGGVMSCARSMEAQILSYFLKLTGKSFIVDTACSSSIHAFNIAYENIRKGMCDQAIVTGVNICISPYFSLQFARLGMLSPEGICRAFDQDANGYVRSESAVAIFLQKEKNARRIYARTIHSKVNSDGYKPNGITYPASDVQIALLNEFYEECGVLPSTISYVEAHGTGTKVGDPEEVIAINEVFCKNRKDTLLIGSTKSNIGHTEPASFLCSLTKVIYTFENNFIPPNINFKTPRLDVEAFRDGRIKVVTEKTKWENNNGLIAINNFGFGGANGHVLVQQFNKNKDKSKFKDNLPRLVCVSARTLNGVLTIMDDIKKESADYEYIGLFHEIFSKSLPNERFRGFTIITQNEEKIRSICGYFKQKKLAFFFNPFNNNLSDIIKSLIKFSAFKISINRIFGVLNGLKSYNIFELLTNYKPTYITHNLILNFAIHVGIVEIMKQLGIEPHFYSGNFIGELVCCYMQNLMSLKQIIRIILKICEGYKNEEDDQQKSHFAISQELTNLIPSKIINSQKWKHSYETNQELTSTLLNSLLYLKENEISSLFSANTIILNCGKSLDLKTTNLNVIDIFGNEVDVVCGLLTSLGRLYQNGFNLKLDQLYPKIKYPVSKQTPMISPLIEWEHKKDQFVVDGLNVSRGFERYVINTKYNDWSFITGHVVNGKNLFPAAGYLYLVMNAVTKIRWTKLNQINLCMENIKFIRATTVPVKQNLSFDVFIEPNGIFNITDKDGVIVSGRVFELDEPPLDEFINFELTGESKLKRLQTKDIYKEFKLRGYNYKGQFRGILESNNLANSMKLKWDDNWITFIDSMLQIQILQKDTRNLFVPTFIQQIIIYSKAHFASIKNNCVDVKVNNNSRIIRSEGIQIRQIEFKQISKRKPLSEPVIEMYKFIPNKTLLTLEESIRINVQIILENNPQKELKSFEMFESNNKNREPLSLILQQAVEDQPLIQADIKLFSDKPIDLTGVTLSDKPVKYESGLHLVIANNLLSDGNNFSEIINVLEPNGFILTREEKNIEKLFDVPALTIFTKHAILNTNEMLILLKKTPKQNVENYFELANNFQDFTWIPKLKEELQINPNAVIVSKGRDLNGILGFINCLRREPGKTNVKCVFIMDDINFNIKEKFFQDQLQKGMHINVLKDSIWGTYRHLIINETTKCFSEQTFVVVKNPGDLSTLTWVEGPLKYDSIVEKDEILVHAYYSSLNFKDVLSASGRIPSDMIATTRVFRQGYEGLEYSGRDSNGRRVFGMCQRGALSTLIPADKYLIYDIPDNWSMEDAATVPVVYSTILVAFKRAGGLNKEKTILIHSGAGGVGQAAINLALFYKCTIFTTVGSQEKRDFLLKQFPSLNPNNIGNSRDTSFETLIFSQTKGRGVDIVLNSLPGERLYASLRCLARNGHMLEIGKLDLMMNNEIDLLVLKKKIHVHGIMLDVVIVGDDKEKRNVQNMMHEGLKNGSIQPLTRTIFTQDQIEDAYRFMSTGKHTGKVLINLRNEERESNIIPKKDLFQCTSKFYCDQNSSYIIIGGLGGFGLELADWLVVKGCKHLVLVSRKGITTGYQDLRIRFWKKYLDNIVISNADVTNEKGCIELIDEAQKLGPVDGIFNLAVVLKDGLFNDLTSIDFEESFKPKALATKNLDQISRKFCPNLRYFVVFSSVSCGRGNSEQTNYGMSNSVMERICEQRHKDGLPALTIQWGAIGDVGLVANMNEMNREVVIGGTLQQGISNCIERLENFLCHDATIISSMVVAEKHAGANVQEVICNILGIKDIKTINLQSTLPELGMDSITGVEIKQIIERDFDISLTPQEIKTMTFTKLKELSEKREIIEDIKPKPKTESTDWLSIVLRNMKHPHLRNLPFITLPSLIEDKEDAPEIYLLPGIEGMCSVLKPLTSMLKCKTIGYQYLFTARNDNIQMLAEDIFENFPKNKKKITLISYSYGCMVGLELADLLEQHEIICNLIFIDGAPTYFKKMFHRIFIIENEDYLKTTLLLELISSNAPSDVSINIKNKILKCSSFDAQLKTVLDTVSNHEHFSREYIKESYYAIHKRLQGIKNYVPTKNKLKSKAKLFRPINKEVEPDYGLSKYFENQVQVKIIDADHVSILHNSEVINEINSLIKNDSK
ncbi:fatty acid synthase-like [Onthophagus taurus]|uniref:fatty acid synthase-like n=1 Tax=Onthophagus taurus TaxID=166361 RepID=UPI0039BE6DA5